MAFHRKDEDIELVLADLDIINWKRILVGISKDDSDSLEQRTQNSIDRFSRLVPGIKKSSKILILSSGEVFLPIFLSSKYSCSITVICENQETADAVENKIKKYEQDEKVSVEVKDFHQTQYDYDYYDMAWSVGVHQNQENTEEILREVRRILVPQGRYILFELSSESDQAQDQSGLPSLSQDDFMKKANRVDLEKVYMKNLHQETVDHFEYILSLFDKEKSRLSKGKTKAAYETALQELKDYLELAKEKQISWGFLQFQKLNA